MAKRTGRPNPQWNRREFVTALAAAALAGALPSEAASTSREVYVIPNTHGASCGWLDTFSVERIYCANNYLNHMDRVRDDHNYSFVLSEVNNIIAMMNFHPERMPELKQRIAEKRVELVNGNFLEPTINLSGGEALVRMGVEGLRWYQRVFGIKPRFAWNIDTCGTHDQMAQIAAGLGLEAMVYERGNPTGKTVFWSESPDGTRILTLSTYYSEASPIFGAKTPLNAAQLRELSDFFKSKDPITPEGAPIMILGGDGDYNLAPAVKEYPSEFLKQWAEAEPDCKVRFSTLSQYLDAIVPGVHAGLIPIPSARGGTAYDYGSFWIENYKVKSLYRHNEHALQAAEALATIASLQGSYEYPGKALSDCWILMCLNMDRNTLWGAAAGMTFVDEKSWDVQDRFDWVKKATDQVFQSAAEAVLGVGEHIGLFNPLNWKRNDPVVLQLPAGKSIEGVPCESVPDGSVLCRVEMPAMSVGGWKISDTAPATPQPIEFSGAIETDYYSARLDAKTGALTSLKLRKSGRELLGAAANVIVAEQPGERVKDDPGDFMTPRPERKQLSTSTDSLSRVQVRRGPLATTVEVNGTFYGGGALQRVVRFYHDSPRIDFETELNDIPNHTIVIAEFPLAQDIVEVRRGIPYGFSHGAWAKPNPNLHGWTKGIVPAIRWIDFSLAGGDGLAIFDRGLTGRELNQRVPILYLLNTGDKYDGYDCPWLSGKGRHVLPYSIVAHDSSWAESYIPRMAWEYNREPVVIGSRRIAPPRSFLETSDNVIVEALRREGEHIELRMVECLGSSGTAEIKMNLPHRGVTFTDLIGRKLSVLSKSSRYSFPIRPQQIVTVHFETDSSVPEPEPILSWDAFVPAEKLAALHAYDPRLIGHPPCLAPGYC